MALMSKLRAVLGLERPKHERSGTTVAVESPASSEPAAQQRATERQPREPTEEPRADGEDGQPVQTIEGIGPAYGERLAAAGIRTIDDLQAAEPAALADETGIGVGRLSAWIERSREA